MHYAGMLGLLCGKEVMVHPISSCLVPCWGLGALEVPVLLTRDPELYAICGGRLEAGGLGVSPSEPSDRRCEPKIGNVMGLF